MDEIQFNITGGPDKAEMIARFAIREPIALETLEHGGVAFRVEMLEHEDGSGQSWNMHGYVVGVDRGNLPDRLEKIYYRSDRRSGVITIEARQPVPA